MAIYNETAGDTANVTDRVNEPEYTTASADAITLLGAGLTFLALSTANVTAAVVEDDFTSGSESATVTEAIVPTIVRNMALSEGAVVRERWFEEQTVTRADSAAAVSAAVPGVVAALADAATATSGVTPTSQRNLLLTETADASSSVGTGFAASIAETAAATSSVDESRAFFQTAAESATATSSVAPFTAAAATLGEVADATSGATHSAVTNATLAETVEAASAVDFVDPAAQAWVMNTETTAMSRYEGVDFTGFAVVGDVLYAVAPDGIYSFNASKDAGLGINASVETGKMDFGMYQHKRIPNVYFGFEADGQLQLKVDTYGEQGPLSYTYRTTVVPALSPVNTRLAVGKGLVSAYWKFTLSNRNGAYFALDKWAADVAISIRRI